MRSEIDPIASIRESLARDGRLTFQATMDRIAFDAIIRPTSDLTGILVGPLVRTFHYKPAMQSVKRTAAHSSHGFTTLAHDFGKRQRTFLCMGVVKSCDDPITWDSDGMAKARP